MLVSAEVVFGNEGKAFMLLISGIGFVFNDVFMGERFHAIQLIEI